MSSANLLSPSSVQRYSGISFLDVWTLFFCCQVTSSSSGSCCVSGMTLDVDDLGNSSLSSAVSGSGFAPISSALLYFPLPRIGMLSACWQVVEWSEVAKQPPSPPQTSREQFVKNAWQIVHVVAWCALARTGEHPSAQFATSSRTVST